MKSTKRNPIISLYCGAEMELFRLRHSKYGTFYEGFADFIAKSPPNHVVDNEVFEYNKSDETACAVKVGILESS